MKSKRYCSNMRPSVQVGATETGAQLDYENP